MMRASQVTINYEAIAENALAIASHTGKEIFAVVKNNAYNFGLDKVVATLLRRNVKHFAVTTSEEAAEIKKAYPEAYVLQLNPATAGEIEVARDLGIALSVTSEAWLETHKENLWVIELHLKMNAGMNRYGVRGAEGARRVIALCGQNGLKLTGLHTHFPLAEEEDTAGHDQQIDEFAATYEALRDVHEFSYIHAENTATLLRRDKRLAFCNFVRPGILLYGYVAPPASPQDWLQPSLFVRTRVVDVHEIGAGEHLGYGTSFVAPHDMRIAVLPIGYGDGLLRVRKALPVYIGGRPYPIAGNISMSHTYVEAGAAVEVGDIVEIYGENARPDRLAAVGIAANSEQTTALHTGAR